MTASGGFRHANRRTLRNQLPLVLPAALAGLLNRVKIRFVVIFQRLNFADLSGKNLFVFNDF
jgi:hypothetical protein